MNLPKTLNQRDPETHKGDYGHALLVAGSYGKMGCAVLAAKAAMRTGAGLLTVHLPKEGVGVIQTAFPEAMTSVDTDNELFSTIPDHLERYTALAVGPGIGTAEITCEALARLLESWQEKPLVLDADALNILAKRKELLPLLEGHSIVTPHTGEYSRLFGAEEASETAQRYNLVVVQKRHRTRVFSPDGQEYQNTTGNAGMATAGSGDVLTGIILGLLAQGLELYEAAKTGVYLHGKSGDLAIEKQSQASLIASDLIENLKYVTI